MLTPSGAKLLDFGLAKPACALIDIATITGSGFEDKMRLVQAKEDRWPTSDELRCPISGVARCEIIRAKREPV